MLHILANVEDYLQTINIYAFGILFYAKQLISTLVSNTTSGATEKKRNNIQIVFTTQYIYIPQTSFIVVSMLFQTHP